MYAVSAPTAVLPTSPTVKFPHRSWSWSEKVLITSRYGKSIDCYHGCKRMIWECVDHHHRNMERELIIIMTVKGWFGEVLIITITTWKECWLSSWLWKGDLGKVLIIVIISKVLVIILTVKGWFEKVLIIVIIWKNVDYHPDCDRVIYHLIYGQL